jgi:hypothetical protein
MKDYWPKSSKKQLATRRLLRASTHGQGRLQATRKIDDLRPIGYPRSRNSRLVEGVSWSKDELDFAAGDFTPKVFTKTEELIALHDDLVAKAEQILTSTPESEFEKMWTMRQGEMIFFTLPKHEVVRTWCLNHLYHHRAQLGVYLRLLDVPLPSIYGPSADEN